MSLSMGAWTVLIAASAILYGGCLYYVLLAIGLKPRDLLRLTDTRALKAYWNSGKNARMMIVGGVLTLLLIVAMWASFAANPPDVEPGRGGAKPTGDEELWGSWNAQGTTEEGSETEVQVDTKDAFIVKAVAWLNWTDDDTTSNAVATNEPDSFTFTSIGPDGEEKTASGANDASSGQGSLSVKLTFKEPILNENWTIKVSCTDAGDSEGIVRVWETDTGNAWTVEIIYQYLE